MPFSDGMSDDETSELPSGQRSPLWGILGAVVVAIVALAVGIGTGGDTTAPSDDPDVLDIATADAADAPLPAAPGSAPTAASEAASPSTAREQTTADGIRVLEGAGLVSEGAEGLVIFMIGEDAGASSRGFQVGRLDMATGEVRQVPHSMGGFFGGIWPQLAPLGDGIAVVTMGGLERLSAGLDAREPIPIRASGVISLPDHTAVWAVGGQPPFTEVSDTRLIDSDGSVLFSARLPTHVTPVAAINGGLIIEGGGAVALVHRGGAVSTISEGSFLSAGNDLIAVVECGGTLDCDLVVRNGAGEDLRTTRVPDEMLAGDQLRPSTVALSPDGRYLAYPRVAEYGYQLAVADLQQDRTVTVPEQAAEPFYGSAAWAPHGHRLLVTHDRRGEPTWWDLESGHVTPIPGMDTIFEAVVVELGR